MFGITGKYRSPSGTSGRFEAPIDEAARRIQTLPPKSVTLIAIYAHGMPGAIGEFDADQLVQLLAPRMREGGQIQLLGCSTAGADADFWNPVGGIGLLARAVMYAPFDNEWTPWTTDLSRTVSHRIPGVYVLGLSGISFPLSRIADWFGAEGYRPRGLMANRYWYRDGRKLPRTEWPGAVREVPNLH